MAKVTTALLCDHAAVYDGKISILGGGVSSINGPTFPLVATLWFVGRIEWADVDLEQHHVITLRCEHQADGEQLARLEATVEASAQTSDADMSPTLNVIVPLPLELRRPGLYVVSMSVDGEVLASLPLKPNTLMPNA